MVRAKAPPPPPDEIPAWFMTYSDVVTLLMTFFILLLTFSTTEPERFEQIRVSLFSGSGATGMAGTKPKGLEKDSFLSRVRPSSARLVMRGMEMPPIHRKLSIMAPEGELAGLEDDKYQDLADRYSVELNLYEMISSKGKLYSLGKEQAKMLAIQLLQLPMHIAFEVSTEAGVQRATSFANHIFTEYGVKPGQMGVRISEDIKPQMVRIIIEHHLAEE